MKSVFTQKTVLPTTDDLKKALGDTYEIWISLLEFTKKANSKTFEEWKYSSEKYGWSFRINDKKRVVIYLLPRDNYFKVAFVFGQKATDEILKSTIAENIVDEIKAAKVYAEGRGIRLSIHDTSMLKDLEKLISIKIAN